MESNKIIARKSGWLSLWRVLFSMPPTTFGGLLKALNHLMASAR
jgi:hypothetical protein